MIWLSTCRQGLGVAAWKLMGPRLGQVPVAVVRAVGAARIRRMAEEGQARVQDAQAQARPWNIVETVKLMTKPWPGLVSC